MDKKRDRKLEQILLSKLPITEEEYKSPHFSGNDLYDLLEAWTELKETDLKQCLSSIARFMRTFG